MKHFHPSLQVFPSVVTFSPSVIARTFFPSVIARSEATKQSHTGHTIKHNKIATVGLLSTLAMARVAFTLAEVLITLAIIGVVAAMAIPSVISNAQQQEFKTGLRKAVSVLNSAITMNIALEGESPYDNHDLFRYLQRHMSVMKSTSLAWSTSVYRDGVKAGVFDNSAFYTTDGMRFEFYSAYNNTLDYFPWYTTKLHESDTPAHILTTVRDGTTDENLKCGSYGLNNNPNNTTATPCIITVDVNGDRKPFPVNMNCMKNSCADSNKFKILSPDAKKVTDIFTIMVTEDRAVPYGVVAQKAMYQAQK